MTKDKNEIVKPGGFTLMFIKKISEKTKRNFLSISILDKAFCMLEKEGIITYDIIREKAQELPEDLIAFSNVKWIELSNEKVKLTPKGINILEKSKLPSRAVIPFEKVVKDIVADLSL
jgi:hypothetical protein